MKHLFLTVFFLSCFSLFAEDQMLNDAELPEAELHVAINPLDTNNIVLAVQHGFGNEDATNITIYYTTDFGVNWNISDYHGYPEDNTMAGDPVLAFDDSGNLLLINLIVVGQDEINTVLSKSSDGGATWSHVSTIATIISDKPWIAVDRFSGSLYKGNIYVPLVENLLNLYTLNSSYETTNVINIPDGDQLPSVVVKSDGTVFTSVVGMGSTSEVLVQEYSIGGTNLVHSTSAVSFPNRAFNAPDISMRFQPTAYLAVDNSGGDYDGRLYLSYTASEKNNENYFNVFLTYSDDRGLTWSTPKTIHSDSQDEIQQFYSSMYVNCNGTLIVDWYDRKNYDNTNKLTDFFMGVSSDGGESFTEIQLNSMPSDFEYVVESSNQFGIGEYHQLVATENTALAFWSDGRSNDLDLNVYMAKVNLNDLSSVEEQSLVTNKISITSLYPQPVENIVNTKIKLLESSSIRYEIYNAAGQKLMGAGWKDYQAGEHTLTIDFNFPSGSYYIKFISDRGYFKTQKLISN